ncbi:1-acyl-sn-glycerol-3-phosphate acyltransferase [Nannochloropsis gaditana]|uniref:1-acyl-sn-glycerol-3-phosphate acyltransferase n=1 Tax=Nannochloropsis gaditana TaxID=72520 RepID=W7TIU7_9STRA|nr:1-acyl-sn-glycerol-3-phosphate acyltransferase [Nannochloropsis gaditana]
MTIAIPGTTGHHPSFSPSSPSSPAPSPSLPPAPGRPSPPSSSTAAQTVAPSHGARPEGEHAGLLHTFLRFCNGQGPRDVHIRLKRYPLAEVMGDPHWLDNRWAEKDRVLTYFGRHAARRRPSWPWSGCV